MLFTTVFFCILLCLIRYFYLLLISNNSVEKQNRTVSSQIMLICYGLIVVIRLLASSKSLSQTVPQPDVTSPIKNGISRTICKRMLFSNSGRNRKRVTIMCAVLVSTFVIYWLPYYLPQFGRINGISNTKV